MSIARLALIIAGGVAACFILFFGFMDAVCFAMCDRPPPRNAASLEFVADNADGAKCILNREDVAAGVHEVHAFMGGSGATVELRDETGSAVFRAEDPGPDPAIEQMVPDPLRLEEGRYTVVCLYPDGGTGEIPLTVTAD